MPNETMSFFADTNLLVYVADPANPEKRLRVRDFLAQIIRRHTLVLSPQSLNECYRAVSEKLGLMPRNDARRFVASWLPHCTAPYDFNVTQHAWYIQDRYGLSWWDCMLLASASRAGCDVFLSEDMQHEQKIADMTILSPFKLDPNLMFAE
jgi:predicted nucleic acid-binding protein